MLLNRSAWRLLLICPILGAGPAAAAVATPQTQFHISAAPTSEALIDLALQARISILNTEICRGRSPAVNGRLSVEKALKALVRDGQCSFEFVDPRAVRMVRTSPAVQPAPRGRAQQPSAEPALSELVVTATKSEAAIDEIGGSISVVSGERVSALGASDARDLVGLLSGVSTTNLGPGRDKLSLRGLSDGAFTGRTMSTVGIYLDDVPLTYNAPDPDLRLSDIQQVEVARGPQGALYGAGSISGVYRMIPNKPDLDNFRAGSDVTWSFTHQGGSSRSADGMVNLALVPGRLAVRLVGYDELQGGYIRGIAGGRAAVDRSVRRGGRAALRLQLSDDWRLDLSGAIQRLATADAHYITSTSGRMRRANRVRESHSNAIEEAALTVEGEGSWGSLSSTTGYVRHSYDSQYDASVATSILDPSPDNRRVYLEQARTRMFVNDTVVRSPKGQRLKWLAGLYASETLERTPSILTSRPPGGPVRAVFMEERRDRILDTAVYGELAYDLGGGWKATAGGRAFEARVSHRAEALVRNRLQTRTEDLSFEGMSPKFSLQHEVGGGGLVYALYSEGFRIGGVNSQGLGRTLRAPVIFGADRLQNFELGLKLHLFDNRARVRGALFYEYWHNLQSDQYTPSGGSFTANMGSARDLGGAVEVKYQASEHLSFEGQALFTAAELVRPNELYVHKATDGLPGVPHTSFGGLIEYRRPLSGSASLLLTAQANYVGRSHLTFNADSPTMGGYVSSRVAAEVAFPHWSAGVFVANPLDETGNTFAYGNPFSLGNVRQVTPQRPRTVGVHLSSAF